MCQDLRVQKSLAAIRNGFINCIQAKPFRNVTTKDICTKSLVNRSTFYKYYKDKYVLKEKLTKDIIEEFRILLDIDFLSYIRTDLHKYKVQLTNVLTRIKENEALYKIAWSDFMESNIFEEMQNCIVQKIKKRFDTSSDMFNTPLLHEEMELFAKIFAASAMTTIRWWFESSKYEQKSSM